MNINQRITLEEKQRVDKFTDRLIKAGNVLNIILRVVLFVLTAIFFIKSIKNTSNILWIIFLFAMDGLIHHWKYIWQRQKTCVYTKNLDKVLSTAEVLYYDIKADNEGVTVNDTYTLKWKDVYAAAFTKEYVILSSNNKVAIMIQADDELKQQIGDILNLNKIFVFYVVTSDVNKEISQITTKRLMRRYAKRIVIYILIALIPVICLMSVKNPVKDLTKDDNLLALSKLQNEYHYSTNDIQEDMVINISNVAD